MQQSVNPGGSPPIDTPQPTGRVELHTVDCPCCEIGGPPPGAYQWIFVAQLRGGLELKLHVGAEGHAAFRSMMLQEELDDAADAAVKALE